MGQGSLVHCEHSERLIFELRSAPEGLGELDREGVCALEAPDPWRRACLTCATRWEPAFLAPSPLVSCSV